MESKLREHPQSAHDYSKTDRVFGASTGWVAFSLRDLWEYRELLWLLVWRDITVRYKQTVLGATWAILQPVMTMVIFTVVFGKFAKVPSDGLPYPIFSFAGLLPWNYFSRALTAASTSLVGSSNLVSKVYFPRLILPLTSAISPIADFLVSFLVLLGMMLWFGFAPNWYTLTLPFFLFLALLTSLSLGLWFTSIHVRFRDVGHMIPFLVQIWLYATPVAYPLSLVPAKWRFAYSLNPMVGVVEGFRWGLLGSSAPDWRLMAVSVAALLVVLIGGLAFFKRTERTFADVI